MQRQERGTNTVRSTFNGIGQMFDYGVRSELIFGRSIQNGRVTVIPVNKMQFGFGSGGGKSSKEGSEGAGGGGGMRVSPLGFIEIAEGTAIFRRIVDPTSIALVFLSIGVSVSLVLFGAKPFIRRKRIISST